MLQELLVQLPEVWFAAAEEEHGGAASGHPDGLAGESLEAVHEFGHLWIELNGRRCESIEAEPGKISKLTVGECSDKGCGAAACRWQCGIAEDFGGAVALPGAEREEEQWPGGREWLDLFSSSAADGGAAAGEEEIDVAAE